MADASYLTSFYRLGISKNILGADDSNGISAARYIKLQSQT